MATVRDFRELRCWQEARRVTRDVYALTSREPFAKDFGLRDQMRRAAVSIGSNIAEGFERDSNPELLKFLSYAKGSTGELLSQLHTACDVGYVAEQEFDNMVSSLKGLGAMIARFQTTVKSAQVQGRYHRQPSELGTRYSKPANPKLEALP